MRFLPHVRTITLFVIVASFIGLAFWLRGSTNEDIWLCTEGQWIKHGNPTSPQPSIPCKKTEPSTAPSSLLPINPSNQPMKSFESADFSLQYPDWPNMDPKTILDTKRTKVAVRNEGCALVMTVTPIPANQDFQTALEQLLSQQVAQANARILSKNIAESTSHVEAEFSVGSQALKTDQYGFLSSERNFYSIVFAAEQASFATACKPMIDQTVKSVSVR